MSTLLRCAIFCLLISIQSIQGFKRPPVSECKPKVDELGSFVSVTLQVKEFKQGMSNLFSYGAKQIGKASYVINSNSTKLIHSKYSAYAVVNNNQICFSYKKVTILDQNGENETRSEQCQLKCFAMNQTAVIQTSIEEGGKIMKRRSSRLCCFWSSTKWLEVSIQKPSYKCASCYGDRCYDSRTRMVHCSPGAGCFSMVFRTKIGNVSIVYPVKGCTHDSMMYGRTCWAEQCRNISVNYNLCISCCYGNMCNENRRENSTAMATTFRVKMADNLQRSTAIRTHGTVSSTRLLQLLTTIVLTLYIHRGCS